MKVYPHKTFLLISVSLAVLLSTVACGLSAGGTAFPTRASGTLPVITVTLQSTRGESVGIGSGTSSATQAGPPEASAPQPAPTQPPPPQPTQPPPPAANQPPAAQPAATQPPPTATPEITATVQSSATVIPVTGTTASSSEFPWVFLTASALLVILILALVARGRKQAVPSAAGPTYASATAAPVTAQPSAPETSPVSPETPIGNEPARYEYYKGMETIQPFEAPPIYDRSYQITVEINRPSAQNNGVLFSMGSPQAGYGMYVQDNRVIFEQALEGVPQRMVSTTQVPTGPSNLRFRFMRTAPFQGIGTLYIDNRLVNSAFFERTLNAAPSEGMDIGYDGGAPLTDAYTPPFPFDGTLIRVTFEISNV